jgi:hypothetical protein
MISVFISSFVRQEPELHSAIENDIVLPRVVSAAFHASSNPVFIGGPYLFLTSQEQLDINGRRASHFFDHLLTRRSMKSVQEVSKHSDIIDTRDCFLTDNYQTKAGDVKNPSMKRFSVRA